MAIGSIDQAAKASAIRFDDRGHAVPQTAEDRRTRSQTLRRGLAERDAIPDDPPDSDEEFWRAIDAGRRERPLFRWLYQP